MESKSNNSNGRRVRRRPARRRRKQARGNGDQGTGSSAYPGVSGSQSNPALFIRTMPLFGQRTRRVVQYATNFISVSSGAGTAGGYVFSANGLFDPDITGTGHQPMGFDQMMIFFNHYTVTRSRCRIQCVSTTAAQPTVALTVSGSSTLLTVPSQIMEVGRVALLWMTGLGVANSHSVLQASCNLRKFQGLRNTIDDPDMRGDLTSNPAEQVYYILYVWNPIDSTTVSTSIQAIIEYDVLFHEPRSPSQS